MPTDESRDSLLAAPLDALRDALAAHQTPPNIENELMAAFARRHPKQHWYQRLSFAQWGMAGGLSCTVAVAAVLMLLLHTPPQAEVDAKALAGFGAGAAFIALEPLERIKREPDPRIVETQIARTALAGFGVPITPENAGDQVRAEILIGADGRPLALRLSRL